MTKPFLHLFILKIMGFLNNEYISSRKMMVYIVMFLWLAMGIFISFYTPTDSTGAELPKTTFTNMAIYFVSLTGFVGSFIYGETKKSKEWTTAMFVKGPTDSRETIVYTSILLWLVSGIYAIVFNVGLDEIGAYFAALTPFVAGYILGETQRSSNPDNNGKEVKEETEEGNTDGVINEEKKDE